MVGSYCSVSFIRGQKQGARSLRIDLRDDLSAMPVSSERSCGRAQLRMVPTLVDLVVVGEHRIRALPAPGESEQRLVESLDLLRDALAHTIRENPDISMERFAAGLPRKSSAPPITLGPAIVHRELDRSALRGATSAPTQRLFRVRFGCRRVLQAPLWRVRFSSDT